MKIAIFTTTRNDLGMVRKCLDSIRANAGCEYDLFIVDNNSNDGVREWISSNSGLFTSVEYSKVSVPVGLTYNQSIKRIVGSGYDLAIKIEPNFELMTPKALETISSFYKTLGSFSAKHIILAKSETETTDMVESGDLLLSNTYDLSFMAIPFQVLQQWRFPIDNYTEEALDLMFIDWASKNGCQIGYLKDLTIKK